MSAAIDVAETVRSYAAREDETLQPDHDVYEDEAAS